ncbi:MAG: arylesterase [Proteobacteria bacterium]|nr:arylesterase [Pseudomonadota bacterium]MBI3499253.1 arylesterase [Pseudomonadota bacterium]
MLPFAAAEGKTVRLMALGDSLTAGYGVAAEDAFPAQLERRLRAAGLEVTVVNAGVSGDTTQGGLARLDWALADKPDLALVALGANDALRGLDPKLAFANLDRILSRLGERGVGVLLVGMKAPRNLGEDYVSAFDGIYPKLAAAHKVPLYPFMLDGVALDPALNQADGMHPNAKGVAVLVERMLPSVRRLIETAD